MKIIKFEGSILQDYYSIQKIIKIIIKKKIENNNYIILLPSLALVKKKLIKIAQNAKNNKNYKNQINELELWHIDIIKKLISIPHQTNSIIHVKKNILILEEIIDSINILQELSKNILNKIISIGEILSSYIIKEKLNELGKKSKWINSNNIIKIKKYDNIQKIDYQKTYNKIHDLLKNNNYYNYIIISGFNKISNNESKTLINKINGADRVAYILTKLKKFNNLEIWNDDEGVMSADNKIVKQAFQIKNLSYTECIKLANIGHKFIYTPIIYSTMNNNIPIHIINNKTENKILYINNNNKTIKKSENINPITIINGIKKISLLTVEFDEIKNINEYSKKILEILNKNNITITLINQIFSECYLTIAIKENIVKKAKIAIEKKFNFEIKNKKIKIIEIKKDLSMISVIGDNMKNLHGISGKMFIALGNNKINIYSITQGLDEKNISTIIERKHFIKATNILHESFFEQTLKQIHIFIVGVGQVGSKLIEQIQNQINHIKKHLNIKLIITGIANSKKMIFNKEGLNLNNWKQELKQSNKKMNIIEFIKTIKDINLHNNIFVDNTNSEEIAKKYETLLKNFIHVITCNKIACSSDLEYYNNIKKLSKKFNSSLLFEANVGAGLPIISTLQDLINSGDEINKIEAVLSGSLNFIFNNFNEKNKFYKIVKKAQNKGYTEPDPRIDLSGIDVKRKILILARECGAKIEINNIEYNNFLPRECLNTCSVNEFYEKLKINDIYFQNIFKKTNKQNKKLRFIAKYEKQNTTISLTSVNKYHPFYYLEGQDNMFLYFTKNYKKQPLIIKGAGAGAEVTASGVFSDIIKASSKK